MNLTGNDPLTDFERFTFAHGDISKSVLGSGAGPAIIVLTEMPGISPQVARFARWLRDAGFRVYMPSLFGKDGELPAVEEGIAVFKKACVSAEFRALEKGKDAPITDWLRALAVHVFSECGGRGVGAVGMCFTGNFALSMMLEAPTMAPVVCQPSLPLDAPAEVGISAPVLGRIRERLDREDLKVLGFRFEGDKWCTAERFDAYAQALGPRFVPTVLPASSAHREPPPFFKHVVGTPHSVVTAHLVDREGEPTLQAKDQIVAFMLSVLKRNI
jgi:dienelactone hydrolase